MFLIPTVVLCQFISAHDGAYTAQYVYDDGKSEHRVCAFEDLVLWEGELIYIADGKYAHARLKRRRHC